MCVCREDGPGAVLTKALFGGSLWVGTKALKRMKT